MITPYRSGETISLRRMNCIPLAVNQLCSQLRRLQASSATASLGKVYHPRMFAGATGGGEYLLPNFQPAYRITTEDYTATYQVGSEIETRQLSFVRVNTGGVASPQGVRLSPTSWFDISPQGCVGGGVLPVNGYIFVVVTTGEVVFGCSLYKGEVPHNRCLWLLACIKDSKVQYPTWEGYIWHCMEFQKPPTTYFCSPQIPVWTCAGRFARFDRCNAPLPTIKRCYMERKIVPDSSPTKWCGVPCSTTSACREVARVAYWNGCGGVGWTQNPQLSAGASQSALHICGSWLWSQSDPQTPDQCTLRVFYDNPQRGCTRGGGSTQGIMYYNCVAQMGCFAWTREPFMRSDGGAIHVHYYACHEVCAGFSPDESPAGCYFTEYEVHSANATCGYGVQTLPVPNSAKYIMQTGAGFECYSARQPS